MPEIKRIFAYGSLVAGGIAGIMIGEGKKVAMIGFALYAVHGALGFLQIITKNGDIDRFNREIAGVLAMALGHGLITTDYCQNAGLDMPKSLALNMICPVVYLLDVYVIKNNDLLIFGELGHAISCCAMVYYGYDKSEYMAYIVALLFCIIYFASMGIYETYIMVGITCALAGMLLAGKKLEDLVQ